MSGLWVTHAKDPALPWPGRGLADAGLQLGELRSPLKDAGPLQLEGCEEITTGNP